MILDFFRQAVPEIGLFPSMVIVILVFIGYYLTKTGKKKDDLINGLIDKSDAQSKETIEAIKVAIGEIKDVSIMTMSETRELSGRVSAIVDIVTNLMRERDDRKRDNGGGDS